MEGETDNAESSPPSCVDDLENVFRELEEVKNELVAAVKRAEKAERLYQRSLDYNNDLRNQVDRLSKQLHDYKTKEKKKCNVSTQTVGNENTGTQHSEIGVDAVHLKQQVLGGGEKATVSIAESLRETAQAAVENSGFVYDENTGLYYDSVSGYYYDNENSLYFDPPSGTYFYYDDQEGEYKFHSKVDMSQYYASQSNTCSSPGYHGSQGQPDVQQQTSSDQLSSKQDHRKKHRHKKSSVQDKKYSRKRLRKEKSEEKEQMKDECMDVIVEVDSSSEDNVKCEKSLPIDEKSSSSKRKQEYLSSDGKCNNENTNDDSDLVSVDNMECDSDSESELESGELTESDQSATSSDDSGEITQVDNITELTMDESNPVNYPPCIRVMVTDSEAVEPGTLFIVTFSGGTIGREGSHVISLPELNVSKCHAEIQYSQSDHQYVIVDRGSQNGTFLNDSRISEPKCEGEPCCLNHRDTLLIGSSHLLCHIHAGLETCDLCEPGQVRANLQAQQIESKDHVILSKAEKDRLRKNQLKQIKKKYGLAKMDYEDNAKLVENNSYSDRADERRKTVGSENPHQKTEAPASVHRPISGLNKGHKMLQKMGWTEGGGLGKTMHGIQEPVKVSFRLNKSAGLGSSLEGKTSLDNAGVSRKSSDIWFKTQQRFGALANQESSTDKGDNSQSARSQGQWVKGDTLDLSSSTCQEEENNTQSPDT